MPQTKKEFGNANGPLPISAVLDAGTWLWARLDSDQLEMWLGDYIWLSEFASEEDQPRCARTRDELVVECALRNRHDLIRRAWARLARNSRGAK